VAFQLQALLQKDSKCGVVLDNKYSHDFIHLPRLSQFTEKRNIGTGLPIRIMSYGNRVPDYLRVCALSFTSNLWGLSSHDFQKGNADRFDMGTNDHPTTFRGEECA
jgi:hypothetical protein